jgi:hypothetical protein
VVTLEGLPLGVLVQEVWARSERDKRVTSSKRPPAERESQQWLTSLRAVGARREAAPQTTIISVGAREAAIYDLFLVERPRGVELLVRAQHAR